MGLVKSSVAVTLTTAGIKADYHLGTPRHVYGHLTKGFSVKNDTATMAPAWTAVATMNWDGGTTGGLEFGFLQIQENLGTWFDYVGATPADGSIRLLVTEPPAMPKKLSLDSHDLEQCRPFTHGQPGRWDFNTPVVTVNSSDHPCVKVLKKMTNSTTGKANYLRGLTDKRKYWTILAIKDGTSYQFLRHFTWSVSWEATFKWAGGKTVLDTAASPGYSFGSVQFSRPAEQKLDTILASPSAPMSNDLMTAAVDQTVKNGQTPNRKDHADGTCGGKISVPADFFS
jgi:hypothetical protein